MRIQRYHTRLSFRGRRRRRAGCLPFVILLGVLVGVGTLSWTWIQGMMRMPVQVPLTGSSVNDRLAAAVQAFDRGDLNGVVDITRGILAEQPDRAEAIVLLARALVYRSYSDYNRGSDRQSAIQLTTMAVQRAPSNLDLLAVHAFAQSANGNPAGAAETARRVLDRDADHALARTAMALAYGNVGSFEIALRESQRATEGRGWRVDALRALALSQSDMGDYASARATVDRAISLNNHLPLLYFEKALYALQIGDVDSATQAYYQIVTFDPNNAKARLRLCELSSTMRERDSAVLYCSEVTRLAPSWADGWYQLGREYFLQGNFESARDSLHHCSVLQVMQGVPITDRRFECWYLQGQAAEILGDCESLVATYNEFRAMTADAVVQQTWTYPPEGPPGCMGVGQASS
jgi:tetratricopeptide (TPR) repeat protein